MSNISICANESSKLYHLEPIDKGTMFRESLTGYIARLAQNHLMDVSQLINYELVPVLQKEYLSRIAIYGGTRFYNNASMINGVGQTAFDFVEALQHLTLIKDLLQCTLYPWRRVIPSRGLISSVKQWCPLCYHEALEEQEELYEPLVWTLQSVKACPMHGIKLLARCPECKQELRILDRCSRPGFCNKCKTWLGSNQLAKGASAYEIAIAKQAANVLNAYREAHHADERYIVNFFNLCTSHFDGGVAEFSRFIGISKTTVWGWCKGQNLPALPSLLAIAENLKVETRDILLGKVKEIQIETPKVVFSMNSIKVIRNTIDENNLKQVLYNCIQSESLYPPSMREVTRQLKIPRKVFEYHFPELCKSISSRYLSYRGSYSNYIKEQRKIEVRKICESLAKQGVFPSRRKVEELASWKAALRNPELQKEWKRVVYGMDTL